MFIYHYFFNKKLFMDEDKMFKMLSFHSDGRSLFMYAFACNTFNIHTFICVCQRECIEIVCFSA